MDGSVAQRLVDQLTVSDIELVAGVVGRNAADARQWIVDALLQPSVHDALFDRPELALSLASPALVFTVAVHGVAHQLSVGTSTTEWLGPRTRLPVFDVPRMRSFVADPLHRVYLAELLGSFTRVSGWTQWERTTRGWRRNHFSELDPVQLAQFATTVDERDRPYVWRRLGDLSLFLTGVFPDHTATRQLGPVREQRLRRIVSIGADEQVADLPSAVGQLGAVGLFELVGERAYRRAIGGLPRPLTGPLRIVEDMAAEFRVARRVLNLATERYIFPMRERYFSFN